MHHKNAKPSRSQFAERFIVKRSNLINGMLILEAAAFIFYMNTNAVILQLKSNVYHSRLLIAVCMKHHIRTGFCNGYFQIFYFFKRKACFIRYAEQRKSDN